jgi:hypothetical protein
MIILIETAGLKVTADLADCPTARELFRALPLKAAAQTWGDEIYFRVPVDCELDGTARELVSAGDLGYWPSGRAFCIFFGPTPVSGPGEIRPASAVNIIGRVRGPAEVFRGTPDGAAIELSRQEAAEKG